MKAGIEIAESPFVVEYDYRITSRAIPASRDEPASAMEFEIILVSLYADLPNRQESPALEIPAWLANVLIDNLQQSDATYEEICEAEAVGEDDR